MITVYSLTDLKKNIKPESKLEWPYLIVGHLKIGLVDDIFYIHRGDDTSYCRPKDIVALVNEVVA